MNIMFMNKDPYNYNCNNVCILNYDNIVTIEVIPFSEYTYSEPNGNYSLRAMIVNRDDYVTIARDVPYKIVEYILEEILNGIKNKAQLIMIEVEGL